MTAFKAHILIITPGFAADEADDTCIPPLQAFVRSLSLVDGARVSVITLDYPNRRKPYVFHGITVYPCHSASLYPFKKLSMWLKCQKWARLLMNAHPFDLVHSFWLNDAAMMGLRVAHRFKKPHLTTLMGQDVRPQNKYLRLLSRFDPSVVALSRYQQSILHQYSTIRAHGIIPWGLDQRTHSGVAEGRSYDLIGVGAFTRNKAYDEFVQVVAKLRSSHPELRVVLIGQGEQERIIKRLITQYDLGAVIDLKEGLSRDKVISMFRSSKILLHPAHFEGFGYVFSEALASGCYVVSRPVGWALEVKSDKWCSASSMQGMTREVEVLLDRDMDFTPTKVPLMAQTVEQYKSLYKARLISG